MGMDLCAIDCSAPEDSLASDGFHANWTWWGVLTDMLDRLDADLTGVSGSNDGDIVEKDVALSWAALLEQNLDSLYLLEVNMPEDKFRTLHFFIAPGHGYDLLEMAKVPNSKIHMLKDIEDTYTYVKEFIEFCRYCGGFAQY
jgi:hypothetical protein